MIYLDNNATTRPAEEVVHAMDRVNRELWGNPSSIHRFGQVVRQQIELARANVAKLIGGKPNELIFTSGGTESNTLALSGQLPPPSAHGTSNDEPGATLITTPIEHAAVREPAEAYEKAGGRLVMLPVSTGGLIAPQAVAETIVQHAAHSALIVISIQWANNETGVIQPIETITSAMREAIRRMRETQPRLRVLFHVDGTQMVGKLPVDVKAAGIDLMTFAGHKFHGPKGAGALYVRSGVRLRPVHRGGPQERERRRGPAHTAGIVGLGVAAELARAFVDDDVRRRALEKLRDVFEQRIASEAQNVTVNSGEPGVQRLWNTSNLGFRSLEAEAILLGLSERGVCASAGAACSSGSLEPSPVLRAMGIEEATAHGSLRFSISRETTPDELERAAELVLQVVGKLRKALPVGA